MNNKEIYTLMQEKARQEEQLLTMLLQDFSLYPHVCVILNEVALPLYRRINSDEKSSPDTFDGRAHIAIQHCTRIKLAGLQYQKSRRFNRQ